MTKSSGYRRKRLASDRRVWVYSQLNHDLQPEQIAKILVRAGLEQARREADAQLAALSAEEASDD